MNALKVAATQLTPSIQFDYERDHLSITGESYPENVHSFYAPVFASLQEYLAVAAQAHARVNVELAFTYVNSASTRSLQQLLTMLDAAAGKGAEVRVNWFVDPEDDALIELGEDLLLGKQWLAYEIVRRQQ